MTIGPDLNEVHEDVGETFRVLYSGEATYSGECGIFRLNRQVTKPFIREFFVEGVLNFDTVAVPGDIVIRDTTGVPYILMNKVVSTFENAIIEWSCTLYKCNVSGELLRDMAETGDRDPTSYALTPEWQQVRGECYGLLTEALYGHDLETDEELGGLGLENNELYIPQDFGVQLLDRYNAASGEYFQVETIKKRRYDSVFVCEVGEDTRAL